MKFNLLVVRSITFALFLCCFLILVKRRVVDRLSMLMLETNASAKNRFFFAISLKRFTKSVFCWECEKYPTISSKPRGRIWDLFLKLLRHVVQHSCGSGMIYVYDDDDLIILLLILKLRALLSSTAFFVAVYNRRGYWEAQYTADEPLSDASHPYISKNTATSLITQFRRRRKRGVYNECCEKACSYEELFSYCA